MPSPIGGAVALSPINQLSSASDSFLKTVPDAEVQRACDSAAKITVIIFIIRFLEFAGNQHGDCFPVRPIRFNLTFTVKCLCGMFHLPSCRTWSYLANQNKTKERHISTLRYAANQGKIKKISRCYIVIIKKMLLLDLSTFFIGIIDKVPIILLLQPHVDQRKHNRQTLQRVWADRVHLDKQPCELFGCGCYDCSPPGYLIN